MIYLQILVIYLQENLKQLVGRINSQNLGVQGLKDSNKISGPFTAHTPKGKYVIKAVQNVHNLNDRSVSFMGAA